MGKQTTVPVKNKVRSGRRVLPSKSASASLIFRGLSFSVYQEPLLATLGFAVRLPVGTPSTKCVEELGRSLCLSFTSVGRPGVLTTIFEELLSGLSTVTWATEHCSQSCVIVLFGPDLAFCAGLFSEPRLVQGQSRVALVLSALKIDVVYRSGHQDSP